MTKEQFRQRCYEHALSQLGSLFAEMHGRTGHGFYFDTIELRALMQVVCREFSTVINQARAFHTEAIFDEIAGDMKTMPARAAHQAEMQQLLQGCGLRRTAEPAP